MKLKKAIFVILIIVFLVATFIFSVWAGGGFEKKEWPRDEIFKCERIVDNNEIT